MYTFLLIILILTSLVLVGAILMQAGKGGGLAANFGGAGSSSDSFLGTRQASTLLTRTTWIAGSTFLALAFILSMASSRSEPAGSVLDRAFPPAAVPSALPGDAGAGSGAGGLLVPPPAADTGSGGSGMNPPGE